jgi:thymidylate synthase
MEKKNNLDPQYNNLLRDILENGVKKQTRNGEVISVFGRQIRHNMSEGFPLLTGKKMFFKGIVSELLWFLRGDTNIKWLLEQNNNIWVGDAYKRYLDAHPDAEKSFQYEGHNMEVRRMTKDEFINMIKTDDEFAKKWGELGPIYGAAWRNWHVYKPIKIKRRVKENIKTNNISFPLLEIQKDNNDEFIGKKYISNKSQEEFIVVKKVEGGKNSKYLIQFLSNGYSSISSRPNIKKGQVINAYKPYIADVAYFGNPNKNINYYKQAYDLWYNMISRCYKTSNPFYKYYGEKNIFVEERWLCFEYFLEDIKCLPNFSKWVLEPKEFDLDKDYYGSNCYSRDTCYFLPKYENITLKHYKPFKAKNVNTGEEIIEICQKHFASKYNLKSTYISYRLNSKSNKPYNGWVFEWINYDESKYVWRYQLYIDQIANLINELKTNPDSRRLMVNAWNVGELDQMVLPPCHNLFQMYSVEKNNKRYLSIMVNIRSNDVPLGLPFNIASYALLLEIIARLTNMIAEEVIINIGDAHIYLNQMDGVKEQLNREPFELPKLNINTEFWPYESGECGVGPIDTTAVLNSFKDNNFCKCLLNEDIQLSNYQSHPSIKLPLSN